MMTPHDVQTAKKNLGVLWDGLTPARDLSPSGVIAYRTGTAIQLLLLHALTEFERTGEIQQPDWLDFLLLGYVSGLTSLEDRLPCGRAAVQQAVRRVKAALGGPL